MNIEINKKDRTPLYIQLKESIKSLIFQGKFQNGDKLPTTRSLSDKLNINRQTVVNAYKALESEGLAWSHVGRGTFIVRKDKKVQEDNIVFYNIFDWSHYLTDKLKRRISGKLLALYKGDAPNIRISFSWSRRGFCDFPIKKIQRSMNYVIRNNYEAIFDYASPYGNEKLRIQISNILRQKGIIVKPEQLIIVNGSQQAMDLIIRLLLEPGETVVIENPTYTGALTSLQFAQAKIVGIPVDIWGMKVHLLENIITQYHPKFILTTPTFQNPTTTIMLKDRRIQLVSLAEKYQIPIIEDDYGSDLQYQGIELPSLKALDKTGEVIYIGSFSKIMVPGFRIGWIAGPKDVIELLAEIKRYSDLCTSPFLQEIITEFISRGFLKTHINYLRRIYKRRMNLLVSSIKKYFPSETFFYPPQGSVYFWITLPPGIKSRSLLQKTEERGVSFAPGDIFYLNSGGENKMGLRFAFIQDDKIVEGIKIIGEEINKFL